MKTPLSAQEGGVYDRDPLWNDKNDNHTSYNLVKECHLG
jgi:hypothetical protein